MLLTNIAVDIAAASSPLAFFSFIMFSLLQHLLPLRPFYHHSHDLQPLSHKAMMDKITEMAKYAINAA